MPTTDMPSARMPMGADAIAAEQQRFMVRVYNWMTTGLGFTGLVAFLIADSPALTGLIFGNPILPIVLFIAFWSSMWMLINVQCMCQKHFKRSECTSFRKEVHSYSLSCS